MRIYVLTAGRNAPSAVMNSVHHVICAVNVQGRIPGARNACSAEIVWACAISAGLFVSPALTPGARTAVPALSVSLRFAPIAANVRIVKIRYARIADTVRIAALRSAPSATRSVPIVRTSAPNAVFARVAQISVLTASCVRNAV